MGDIVKFGGSFDKGATDPEFYKPDLLDVQQTGVNQLLGSLFRSELGNYNGTMYKDLAKQLFSHNGLQGKSEKALSSILSGKPDFSQNENYFNKGLLGPALRGFDRSVAPNIKDYYAGQGATFSTARGNALTQARGDVFANAQSQLAQYNAQSIEGAKNRQLAAIGIPMQQQLARIQGLANVSGAKTTELLPMISWLGQQHRELVTGPGRAAANYATGGNLLDDFMTYGAASGLHGGSGGGYGGGSGGGMGGK